MLKDSNITSSKTSLCLTYNVPKWRNKFIMSFWYLAEIATNRIKAYIHENEYQWIGAELVTEIVSWISDYGQLLTDVFRMKRIKMHTMSFVIVSIDEGREIKWIWNCCGIELQLHSHEELWGWFGVIMGKNTMLKTNFDVHIYCTYRPG